MQQAVETKPSPLERQLKVAVPVAQLEADIADRIKKLARTVKMQGFRPGKVPLKMVERHYGFQVRQEALSDTVQRLFAEAVRTQNYRVAGMPRFEPVQGGTDQTAFEFQAVFEVYPEITLGDLGAKQGILGGINAVIVGNYLTTLGRPAESDLELLEDLQMPIKALNASL